jgi:hypothetical protein
LNLSDCKEITDGGLEHLAHLTNLAIRKVDYSHQLGASGNSGGIR